MAKGLFPAVDPRGADLGLLLGLPALMGDPMERRPLLKATPPAPATPPPRPGLMPSVLSEESGKSRSSPVSGEGAEGARSSWGSWGESGSTCARGGWFKVAGGRRGISGSLGVLHLF